MNEELRGIAKLETSAELARLGHFAARFVELPIDAEWLTALAAIAQARQGALRTYAQRVARLYLSDFDANALTGMYRMQLLPSGAWRRLLGERARGRLLDVGAGSGDVTGPLADCFEAVETTEVSRGMVKHLQKRGFRCHAVDLSEAPLEGVGQFSAVSLLNVLDRCRKPHALIRRCISLLEPGGTLIVALALPYRPFYFAGPSTPDPEEWLSCDPRVAPTWEDGARRFIERDLLPLDLALECFARSPYLSAGDSRKPLYELDDVVVVLSKS